MDIDLLRTFLEINRTRHFARASHNLMVTQSAVSSRIRLLEETLGVRLFTRTRNDIQLTAAGRRFLRSAESIVELWESARKNLMAEEERELLVVGGVASLWEGRLAAWVGWMRREMPDVALCCETHGSAVLVQGVLGRTLDLGFLCEPPRHGDLEVREVGSVNLVMVASRPGLSARQAVAEGYILMDWGETFRLEHACWFPELPPPLLQLDRGGMALEQLLSLGGAAYLAEEMVQPLLESGRLHPVRDAPSHKRLAFAIFSRKNDGIGLIEKALVKLKGA